MAGKGQRRKVEKKRESTKEPAVPAARALPSERAIDPVIKRRGQVEAGVGGLLLGVACVFAMGADDTTLTFGRFMLVYSIGLLGAVAIAFGAARLDRRAGGPVMPDSRRWIYGGLASLFAVIYALLMWKVIPNRLPSAMLHLATVPAFTLLMAVGTLIGGRIGWWLAVVGGSIVLFSTILLIARILASAAFLAGVYGAFGKAASTFALVSVALLVEVVGLLPICQVKFLMSRPGRRAYGV
jgi:hypothetical protein